MDISGGPPIGRAGPLPDPLELGGTGIEDGAKDGFGELPARLVRYGNARHRALAVLDYGRSPSNTEQGTGRPGGMGSVLGRLERCGSYLEFWHYHTVDQVKLARAEFCKQHLLCQLCAVRRGSTYMGAYLPKFEQLLRDQPGLKPVLVTLTVKNGPDLIERVQHLMKAYKTLCERRRAVRKGNRGATEWGKVAGAVGAIELTRSASGWHPHLHAIVMLDSWIDQKALSEEWRAITGDSFIVGLTAFDKRKHPAEVFAEVFKYAVKFSDLVPADCWEAYRALAGVRLVHSLGCFRGVVVDDSLLDQPLENLPYVKYLYRFVRGSGYNVVSVVRA
jgi:hypothetical protein